MKTNELKCTDLRIGNYVKVNDPIFGVNTYKVATIRDNGIITLSDNISCSVNNIEPIELTEELLVKIGFRKFVKSFRMELSGCRLDYFIDKTLYIYKKHTNCCLIKDLEIKCEYIHQLQNSYFLLTGEELEIEL